MAIRRAVVLAGLLLGVLPGVGSADTFTPQAVAKLRAVGAIAISPDASEVAYTLVVPRRPGVDADGPAWSELHVVSRDGRERPFITGEVSIGGIQWMPDGRSLAFATRRAGDTARSVYVIPVDGGEARRVLSHQTDIGAFRVSPDGTRVAFLARDPVSKERQELERKGFSQDVFEEAVPSTGVWLATLDGRQPPRRLDLPGSASVVQWSPTGDRLAVVLAPTPLVDDEYMARRVHVVSAETGAVVAKLANPGKLGQVAWSPDGQSIAIVSAADVNDPKEGRLLVAPSGGGPLSDVLPNYLGHVSAFAWKDARTLAFIGDEGAETVYGEVGRDGTGRKTIVGTGGSILGAIDLAADGRTAAFVADSAKHPREVYLLGAAEAAPRRLTDSNPWLSSMRLAPQEVVRFKARDGLELQGILVRPLDEKPGQRYPLVLTVHGGPEAHDRNGWLTGYSEPGQVAAARGIAVFYPNYRGSTGRGVAFSKLSQSDAAGKEFDDLVDAVDHFVKIGLADSKRIGITGGSYGGYASMWAATYYSERFAASVAFVGISNNVSRVGTTDIPNEEYYVHALKRPWEDWTYQLQRSPFYHAAKSKTPTLILGGTDDPRVHPSQSLELYRHLKLRGQAPVRLVRYPGEQHGNRRAASRLDYNLRMMQWFEHYLLGPGGAPPRGEITYAEPAAVPAPSVSR